MDIVTGPLPRVNMTVISDGDAHEDRPLMFTDLNCLLEELDIPHSASRSNLSIVSPTDSELSAAETTTEGYVATSSHGARAFTGSGFKPKSPSLRRGVSLSVHSECDSLRDSNVDEDATCDRGCSAHEQGSCSSADESHLSRVKRVTSRSGSSSSSSSKAEQRSRHLPEEQDGMSRLGPAAIHFNPRPSRDPLPHPRRMHMLPLPCPHLNLSSHPLPKQPHPTPPQPQPPPPHLNRSRPTRTSPPPCPAPAPSRPAPSHHILPQPNPT